MIDTSSRISVLYTTVEWREDTAARKRLSGASVTDTRVSRSTGGGSTATNNLAVRENAADNARVVGMSSNVVLSGWRRSRHIMEGNREIDARFKTNAS